MGVANAAAGAPAASPGGEEPEGDLKPGQRLLDRYVVEAHVTRGGMSSIYRAHDERLGRTVCVKILRDPSADGARRSPRLHEASHDGFLREVFALASLTHPNTLRVYDYGYLPEGGPPFQVSEYLDGGDLNRFTRERGALDLETTLGILEHLAGAVGEAHRHGIIHRDIKPSNILFARAFDVLMPKLADFGIAWRAREPEATTADGEVTLRLDPSKGVALFSPRFAAPEQLANAKAVPATDVYGLALTVAFMLEGRPLFDERDIATTFLPRLQSDAMARERVSRLPAPEGLKAALRRALARTPSSRTPSAEAFVEDVRRGLGISAGRLPKAEPSPRRPRDSITLELQTTHPREDGALVAVPERVIEAEATRVRLVEVAELVHVAARFGTRSARLRVSALPRDAGPPAISVKGQNCFVRAPGGRASAAVSLDADRVLELVSGRSELLGLCSVHVGWPGHPSGRLPALADVPAPSFVRRPFFTLSFGEDDEVVVLSFAAHDEPS